MQRHERLRWGTGGDTGVDKPAMRGVSHFAQPLRLLSGTGTIDRRVKDREVATENTAGLSDHVHAIGRPVDRGHVASLLATPTVAEVATVLAVAYRQVGGLPRTNEPSRRRRPVTSRRSVTYPNRQVDEAPDRNYDRYGFPIERTSPRAFPVAASPPGVLRMEQMA